MIQRLDKFAELAKQASTEASPKIDVRAKVLVSISASAKTPYAERIAVRFLIGSMSLAVVTMAVVTVFASQEPPLEMVLPFMSRLP